MRRRASLSADDSHAMLHDYPGKISHHANEPSSVVLHGAVVQIVNAAEAWVPAIEQPAHRVGEQQFNRPTR